MSEHQEQSTFFDWVRLERERAPSEEVRKALKLCYAVPNGAAMKDSQRLRMFREGMEKGILDINLDMPTITIDAKDELQYLFSLDVDFEDLKVVQFCGLRIEMKFGKNKLTAEQKEKAALLEEAGFKVAVCCSAVEAVRTVFEYLSFEANDYAAVRSFL